jgi:hypothetical protein
MAAPLALNNITQDDKSNTGAKRTKADYILRVEFSKRVGSEQIGLAVQVSNRRKV